MIKNLGCVIRAYHILIVQARLTTNGAVCIVLSLPRCRLLLGSTSSARHDSFIHILRDLALELIDCQCSLISIMNKLILIE